MPSVILSTFHKDYCVSRAALCSVSPPLMLFIALLEPWEVLLRQVFLLEGYLRLLYVITDRLSPSHLHDIRGLENCICTHAGGKNN